MKQIIKISLVIFFGTLSTILGGMCGVACNISDHTTLVPRRMSQNSVLELGLHNYYQFHGKDSNECESWFNVAFTAPYFFKTTKNTRTGEYFFPACSNCITIGENNSSTISSPWLQIMTPVLTPYQSTLCINPSRMVIGGALRVWFSLKELVEHYTCWNPNWWLSIFIPVQQVTHNLHPAEVMAVGSVPGVAPGFSNAIDAFNNPAWNFGKLSGCPLKKTGVDDITVKLGFDFYKAQDDHATLYGVLFVPTGKGTQATYLFEPLVGSKHTGIGLGINGDYKAVDYQDYTINFMIDARYAFFMKHKELRSIDLYNGDLSRYLLVAVPSSTVTPLPGINFFTQNVSVTPRSMFEVWAAASLNYGNFHVEVGYDFWFKSKEKIQLPDGDLGVGIFDIATRPPVAPTTAHCARICQAIPGVNAPTSDSPAFITVKNSQAITNQGIQRDGSQCCRTYCASDAQCSYLNLNSAANPKALSSTFYAALAYDSCLCAGYLTMIGIGAQYEIAHRNSALSQYGFWLKGAVNF